MNVDLADRLNHCVRQLQRAADCASIDCLQWYRVIVHPGSSLASACAKVCRILLVTDEGDNTSLYHKVIKTGQL